tara:strand:- start:42581 stop:43186 length:606 start_codon:yes stop_codon:yes gene_type:complete
MLACAVALILLIDVSGSVSPDNLALQRLGIVSALETPQVKKTILNQPGGMALAVIEWSGTTRTILPWQHVKTPQDLDVVIQHLQSEPPGLGGVTAMGWALQKALEYFDQVPCAAELKIIDVSGDGASNEGPGPQQFRDQAQAREITINGLPIVTYLEPDIADYYQNNVVTLDGFVITAEDFQDFSRALRRKLVLEISRYSR